VVIKSQDPSNRAVFNSVFIQNTTGLTFSNLNVVGQNSNGYSVQAWNNRNITVGGLKVGGPGTNGVGISSRANTNSLVTNNDVGNYAVGIASYDDDTPTVSRNHVHDITVDGIDVFSTRTNTTLTITENYVHDFIVDVGTHPDCIQTAGNGTSPRAIVNANFCYRGATIPGSLPPQGMFVSDATYPYAQVNDNLAVCPLWNGISLFGALSGEMRRNQVIACTDQGSWIRYQENTNITVANNISGGYVDIGNVGLVTSGNVTTTSSADVASPAAASAQIAAWRAQHPNVPTDSTQPTLAALLRGSFASLLAAIAAAGSQVAAAFAGLVHL
jgi:hypothetical protein